MEPDVLASLTKEIQEKTERLKGFTALGDIEESRKLVTEIREFLDKIIKIKEIPFIARMKCRFVRSAFWMFEQKLAVKHKMLPPKSVP